MSKRSREPSVEQISCVRTAAELIQKRMNGRTRSCNVEQVNITLTLTPETNPELFNDEVVSPEVRKVILERTFDLELGDGLSMRDVPGNILDKMPNLRSVALYEATSESALRCFTKELVSCDCHTSGMHYEPRNIRAIKYKFANLASDKDSSPRRTDHSQASLLESSPHVERVCLEFATWGPATASELDEWLVQQPLTALSIGFTNLTCINSNECKWGYFGDHIVRASHADRCPQTAEMSLVELVNVDFTHAKHQFEEFMRQVGQVPRLEMLRFKNCRVPPEYWWGIFHDFACMRVVNMDFSGTILGEQGAGALWKALPLMTGLKSLNVTHSMEESSEDDLSERIADCNLRVVLEGTYAIYRCP